MARIYQVRGDYPGVGGSVIGFRGKGKSPNAKTLRNRRIYQHLTMDGLDKVYQSVSANSRRSVTKFADRVEHMRMNGFELSEDFLRRRYPRVFIALELPMEPPPVLEPKPKPIPVPLPAERVPVESAPSRPGQTEFRRKIIELYGRCAVTGCKTETVLDAAHIIPFVDERSHILSNGLCLRTDIHRLFDAGLLSIVGLCVVIDPALTSTEYRALSGKPIWTPKKHKPSRHLLSIRGQFI